MGIYSEPQEKALNEAMAVLYKVGIRITEIKLGDQLVKVEEVVPDLSISVQDGIVTKDVFGNK